MHSLWLIVGPSGSGKTTLVNNLVRNYEVTEIKSTTTRARREGEHENAYRFVSEADFQKLQVYGALCEVVSFGGNQYGVQEKEFDALENKTCVLIVNDKGARYFMNKYPEAKLIGLQRPREASELYKRLQGRVMDSDRLAGDALIENFMDVEMEKFHLIVPSILSEDEVVSYVASEMKLKQRGQGVQ
jgi:guanylate kinase